MWVVKLGGSLHRQGWLRRWLGVLAASRAPLLVVPGGGAFADRVRAAQVRRGFSDATAHRLGLLAMDRMGELMCTLEPALEAVHVLSRAPRARRAAVWLPAADLAHDPALPASWAVTSDSIAALAARRLGARGLVLVKSASLPGGATPVEALSRCGIVDEAFPGVAAACRCPVWLLHRGRTDGLDPLPDQAPRGAVRALFDGVPAGRGGGRADPWRPDIRTTCV